MSSARRRSKLPSLALPGFDEAAELVAAYAARMARVRPDVECVRSIGLSAVCWLSRFEPTLISLLRAFHSRRFRLPCG